MSLSPGTRVGIYEVKSAIGAGGMGEVYLAFDTRLGRDVALKVLPDEYASNADRLARFRREAQVLASLNHPGIGHIYGVEETGEVTALVLELVEGPTLADLLAAGALPVTDALPIAIEIADALEAAHDKGVVHRDLKPANIKRTPEGRVKVLDFGLAKALADQGPGDATVSPTITAVATRAGVIMGTAAYMSPEQAQGRRLDRRADIWAFGCVLYEMLTGRPAFSGDSVADIVAAVMTSEPDWSRLPAATPRRVRELLARCLQRDLRKRLRDAGDARLDLESALTAPADDQLTSIAATRAGWRVWAPWALSGLLAVVAVTFWWTSRNTETARPVLRLAVPLSVRPVTDLGPGGVLSPDGGRVVFRGTAGGEIGLFVRDLETGDVHAIPGTESAFTPSFSADGRWIFFRGDRKLKRVAISGGPPQTLADAPLLFGAASITDDRIVFTPGYNEGLWEVSTNGGTPKRLTTPDAADGELGHWWPSVIPGGHAVIYTAYRSPLDRATVAVYSFESGRQKTLVEGATNGIYLPPGYLLYFRERALRAVRFDPDRLEVSGPPVVVADDLAYDPPSSGLMASVSNTGTLAFVSERTAQVRSRVVAVDRNGNRTVLVGAYKLYSYPSVSRDGRRLAVTVDDGNGDVWVIDLARGASTKLTFGSAEDFQSRWTPDGSSLFYTTETPNFDVMRIRADGTGQAAVVAGSPLDEIVGSVSDDGTLALTVNDPKTAFDIWVKPPDGHATAVPFRQTPAQEYLPALSPDGHWLAYTSDESQQDEVFVEPYPGPGPRVQVSSDGGSGPVWARDGRTIFYWKGGAIMAASVTAGAALVVNRTVTFASQPIQSGTRTGVSYDTMPDGRLLVLEPDPTAPPLQIQIVLNWVEELRRLLRP